MKQWVEAARVEEFEDTDRKLIDLGGLLQIGLFRVDGTFYAISAWCTHQRATMVHGPVDGYELMCPLHGACFDLRNGRVLSPPAYQSAETYPTKVEDGRVYIRVKT